MRLFQFATMTALSALVLAACSQNQGSQNTISAAGPVAGVYGGDVVSANDTLNQSIVALYSTSDKFLCTGSILSNDLILTAGHCIEGDMTKMIVIFGGNALDGNFRPVKGAVTRPVIKGEHHPDFIPNKIKAQMMDDVGLVRFTGGLPAGYKPATVLVNYPAHVKSGTPVVMAGYGISNVLFKSGAGVLRKVTLTIDDPNYSQAEASINQGLRKGICSGDSGGPSYLQADGKYLLWGVTSRGAGLFSVAPCIFSSIYTRIDYYWSWFQTAAAEMGTSLPAMPRN